MFLSKAIEGYLLDITTSHAIETVRLYRTYLKLFMNYIGDREIDTITSTDLSKWMVYLKTDYTPKRPKHSNRIGQPLSSSSLDNHWKILRSFFGWCEKTIELEKRPDTHLPRPKVDLPEVIPFTEDELKRLLYSCEYTEAERENGKKYKMKRPTAARDRALLLLLLDTGIRVGELCRLTVEDADLTDGTIAIAPYGSGQKTKPRILRIGKNCRRAIWLYLAKRKDFYKEDPLFDLSAKNIRMLLWRLGQRAGISDVHPHRFRHTFAIFFLRSTKDIFTLQYYLGHSSLDMSKHYLHLVEADIRSTHQMGSPVDRMRL